MYNIVFSDFKIVHAPSLLQLENGVILLAFHGKKKQQVYQSIWLTQYKNKQWSEPREILSGSKAIGHCSNPVLFCYKKQLWIFVKTGVDPTQWQGGLIISENEDEHWSPFLSLPDGILGSTKNPPLILPDGRILIPSSREELVRWFPVMEIFDPQSETFDVISFKTKLEPQFRAIQPTLIPHSNHSILALFRTNLNFLYSSTSIDGINWSSLQKTNFPNPNSAITSVTCSENGDTYLAINPSSFNRRKLWLIRYHEEEKYQQLVAEIDHDNYEVSYPSLLILDRENLLVSYAINRRSIAVKIINRNNKVAN